MSFRCEFHLNGGRRKLILAQGAQETFDHLALRVSSHVLFWGLEPKGELSPKHPALAQVEFKPDFIALNDAGEVALWGECGNVSLNKLDKVTKRYPHARVVVLKASPAEGVKMRKDLEESVGRQAKVQVLSWRAADFALWRDAMGEVIEVFGESTEHSVNLVVNQVPLAADLTSH
jgi:hypothetical protein